MDALIVEDDKETALFVDKGLQPLGFKSTLAPDAETGLRKLIARSYDLAIVDIRLPGISGLELIRRIRETNKRLPVIILSSLGQPADKICGLNIGADDYLAKPFALNELTARINALLRRTSFPAASEKIRVKDLVVDCENRRAFRNGRPIILTDREFKVLQYLIRNAGRVLSVKMILQEIWRYDSTPLTTVVETRICLLRQKLCANGEDDLIHTIRGFGYVLK